MSFGSRSLPAPTAEQKRRWGLIRASGCLICREVYGHLERAEIHHVLRGGLRLGHDWTYGACEWHHRGIWPAHLDPERMESICGPSMARTPKAYRHEFGNDEWLVGEQNRVIGWTAQPKRERNRKSRCTTKRALPRRYGP